MAEGNGDASAAEIAVHWQEEEYYQPPPDFVSQANLTDPKVSERFALENLPDYYREFGVMAGPRTGRMLPSSAVQ